MPLRPQVPIILWPIALMIRAALEVLAWIRPSTFARPHFPGQICRHLEQAQAVEVFSLDPDVELDKPPSLHHWHSLGQVSVEGLSQCRYLARTLVRANQRCLGSFKCLDPRYGVRFRTDGRTMDLLICFWCGLVEVVGDIAGAGFYPMSGYPQDLLDEILRDAGIPQAVPVPDWAAR
jgi:hypothetical protein